MRSFATTPRWLLPASRIVVATVSILVLAATAFGWYQVQRIDRSAPVASVITGPPPAVTAEQNILLVGLDARTDALGNPIPTDLLNALHAGSSSDGGDTADSLVLVHVPAGGGQATAVSIPRDSYVDLPDGLGRHKINSAYSRAAARTVAGLAPAGGSGGKSRPAASSDARTPDPAVARAASAAGARATIGAVEALTGQHVTHYAAVTLAGFADLSRAVGGVPVCLRAAVDDPYSGAGFPAGRQEISGAQALAFVRQRHGLPNGDLDRITRQQTFLAGATERLLGSGTLADPSALSRLSAAVSRAMVLDDSWNVLDFAHQLQGLRAGAVTFRTIPTGSTSMSTPEDGSAVEVSPPAVAGFVAAAIAADRGTPVVSPASAPTGPPTVLAPVRPAAVGAGASPSTSAERSSVPGAVPRVVPPPITAATPGCVN